MSDSFIFIFGMLVFGVAIGSSLISIIGTSQLEERSKSEAGSSLVQTAIARWLPLLWLKGRSKALWTHDPAAL